MNGQPAKQLRAFYIVLGAEGAPDAHSLNLSPVSFPNCSLAKGKSLVLVKALNERLIEKKTA